MVCKIQTFKSMDNLGKIIMADEITEESMIPEPVFVADKIKPIEEVGDTEEDFHILPNFEYLLIKELRLIRHELKTRLSK